MVDSEAVYGIRSRADNVERPTGGCCVSRLAVIKAMFAYRFDGGEQLGKDIKLGIHEDSADRMMLTNQCAMLQMAAAVMEPRDNIPSTQWNGTPCTVRRTWSRFLLAEDDPPVEMPVLQLDRATTTSKTMEPYKTADLKNHRTVLADLDAHCYKLEFADLLIEDDPPIEVPVLQVNGTNIVSCAEKRTGYSEATLFPNASGSRLKKRRKKSSDDSDLEDEKTKDSDIKKDKEKESMLEKNEVKKKEDEEKKIELKEKETEVKENGEIKVNKDKETEVKKDENYGEIEEDNVEQEKDMYFEDDYDGYRQKDTDIHASLVSIKETNHQNLKIRRTNHRTIQIDGQAGLEIFDENQIYANTSSVLIELNERCLPIKVRASLKHPEEVDPFRLPPPPEPDPTLQLKVALLKTELDEARTFSPEAVISIKKTVKDHFDVLSEDLVDRNQFCEQNLLIDLSAKKIRAQSISAKFKSRVFTPADSANRNTVESTSESCSICQNVNAPSTVYLGFAEVMNPQGVSRLYGPTLARITCTKFEELYSDKLKGILKPVEKGMRNVKMAKPSTNDLVLVGGSTRTLRIQNLLQDFFIKNKLNMVNPDEIVAYATAAQAANLTGDTSRGVVDLLLLDAVPLSPGIESARGVMTSLVKRNTTISTMNNGNHLLGKLDFIGIPPVPRGDPRFQSTFDIDANDSLNVFAVDKSTGKQNETTITNVKKLFLCKFYDRSSLPDLTKEFESVHFLSTKFSKSFFSRMCVTW